MKRIILGSLVILGALSVQAHAQDTRTFTDPNGFHAKETPGGYEPADPPVPPGTPANAKMITEASIPPSSAYPPPPPAKSYLPCTAQRHDNCVQKR